jgi:hypothetical protein
MYNCILCDYETTKKCNIDKHTKTQKHLNNLKNIKNCDLCKKSFSSNYNLKRHINKYHNNINPEKLDNSYIFHNNINNNINNNNLNNLELIVKTSNKQIIKEVKEVKDVVDKSNQEVKIVVNKAINKASTLIKYLMEHHKSTPPLKKIKHDQCINLLKLEFNCTDKNDDTEYYLEKKFIDDFSKNRFIQNISKCILNLVHYNDPLKQPIWNTDCARLHYVVKTSLNSWNEDKAGIKFTDFIIKPMLKSICDKITNYRKEIIENVDIKRYTLEQNIEHNNLLTSVYSFEYALLRGDLIKLILKELAPHLRYIQKELDDLENQNDELDEIKEMTEMNDLEKIQEELKVIAEHNGIELNSDDSQFTDNSNDSEPLFY